MAALQGKSVQDFILDKLFPIEEEDEKAAIVELNELLLSRTEEAKGSEPINQSFIEVFEEHAENGLG